MSGCRPDMKMAIKFRKSFKKEASPLVQQHLSVIFAALKKFDPNVGRCFWSGSSAG